MNLSFSKSKLFVLTTVIIAELILLLGVFRLGVLVGFRKASFSYRWGENYHHLFGGPRRGWFQEFDHDDYISSSGVAGVVLSVSSSTVTVRGMDNVERSVVLDSSTTIQKNHAVISLGDIKPNDRIMVIGAPSSTGQVEAKFIRIFSVQ